MWVDYRRDAKKDVRATKHRDGYTTGPKYETIHEMLGIGDTSNGFAVDDDENQIAEMVASGEIDLDDLPALIEQHGSIANVLRMARE